MHMPAVPALQLSFVRHAQALIAQTKPFGQSCPHAPQLPALVVRSEQPL